MNELELLKAQNAKLVEIVEDMAKRIAELESRMEDVEVQVLDVAEHVDL